ncbi:hypothetical protein HYU23_00590 [Candidatus Woesearchaeota archaeon]|nr:hypothetical protein [Candidatus Woesearchaeota archaeon]
MKTYNNLYKFICSYENLKLAFEKAKKNKTNKDYVIKFKENLEEELRNLQKELELLTYKPRELKRFIVRDPKTRVIHASAFRDRVVYHALINIIEPIFEKVFIYDSYASRVNKGTLNGVIRFDKFKRKISNNGRTIRNSFDNNHVIGYVLKADIKHYFETINHEILLKILNRKIKDEKILFLIKQTLDNYEIKIKGVGIPLGNLTSQFFANVYLNELDYFIKHKLRIKYYIRYVDDFVIFHKNKKFLEYYKKEINLFLINELKLELHPNKSNIVPLRKGVNFLGYRIFYHYKLLRKCNLIKFKKNIEDKIFLYKEEILSYEELNASFEGWSGYAMWANTHKLRKNIRKELDLIKK